MTVETQTDTVTGAGNDSATSFSFSDLVIAANTELEVTHVVDATGVENTLALTTDYTVTVASYPGTGTVEFPAGGSSYSTLATGETLRMKRVKTLSQATDLENQGGYFPEVQETAFDKATMIDIQQQEELDRCIKIKRSEGTFTDLEVPDVIDGTAGNVIGLVTGKTGFEWLTPNSSTYVNFPASATDNAVVRFDGTGGLSVQNSGVLIDDSDNITAVTTLTVDGDTSAGDTATLGYTATEGLILTGQGSSNDVTVKNDADATVIEIPTGTTNVDMVGVATAATFEPDGDTSSGDNAAIGYTATEGLVVTGQGSTSDVTVKNDADATVLSIPTGTTTLETAGNIELGHATDTTIARDSAGVISVEGNVVYRAGGTDVPVADGGTGGSSTTAYAVLCGGTTSTAALQSIASVGSSGQVLTSNGASALPTFQAASGGTTHGTETATTSGSSVDITGIPSGTTRILITFDGVSVSGTDALLLQLGDSGGIETSGYVGNSHYIDAATPNDATNTTGILLQSPLAANLNNGHLLLTRANSASFRWIASGLAAPDNNSMIWYAYTKSLSSELTQIRLETTGTDTFDAGSFLIQYE